MSDLFTVTIEPDSAGVWTFWARDVDGRAIGFGTGYCSRDAADLAAHDALGILRDGGIIPELCRKRARRSFRRR